METEVSSALVDELLTLANAGHPLEVCGLLLGNRNRISGLKSCANVHPSPESHFEIDPRALIAAHRAEREGGPLIVGYYHSHPEGPAEPSSTDRAYATGDGKVWAIVGEGRVGWWRDCKGGFVPLSYVAAAG
jgi:proteasome lid subunit RPN8/RPN11